QFWSAIAYPGLRFACPGLSTSDAYGVKRHEASLHFYLTILTRALYKNRAVFVQNITKGVINKSKQTIVVRHCERSEAIQKSILMCYLRKASL
ncbi:MAG: hypothetical protein LBK58_03365, partial [Prevotellaceae bacterium]|nr:hypothetical protein [Prevotellaceae bacterium]